VLATGLQFQRVSIALLPPSPGSASDPWCAPPPRQVAGGEQRSGSRLLSLTSITSRKIAKFAKPTAPGFDLEATAQSFEANRPRPPAGLVLGVGRRAATAIPCAVLIRPGHVIAFSDFLA
jgi:hypothetical protein